MENYPSSRGEHRSHSRRNRLDVSSIVGRAGRDVEIRRAGDLGPRRDLARPGRVVIGGSLIQRISQHQAFISQFLNRTNLHESQQEGSDEEEGDVVGRVQSVPYSVNIGGNWEKFGIEQAVPQQGDCPVWSIPVMVCIHLTPYSKTHTINLAWPGKQ